MLSGSAEGSVMTDTSGSTMTSRSSISDKFARGVIRELGKAFVPESGPRVAEGFEDYDAAYYALGEWMRDCLSSVSFWLGLFLTFFTF